jgi:hypothetical protein
VVSLAETAVFVALALRFFFIAQHANELVSQGPPPELS